MKTKILAQTEHRNDLWNVRKINRQTAYLAFTDKILTTWGQLQKYAARVFMSLVFDRWGDQNHFSNNNKNDD